MLLPLTVWITANWKILKEIGIPDHLTCLLETCMQIKKQQLEPDMELIQNWERSSCMLSAYLTSMQSSSCKMLDWMNHKLESRFPGETTTSDM